MQFTLDRDWRKGLGTELCVFSTLLDCGVKQLNINYNLKNFNFEIYKKIFNVTDEQLKINHTLELSNEMMPSDLFKIMSSYYKIPNPKKHKKYIGLACYQDTQVYENPGLNYPEIKMYSIDQYKELYKLVKKNGWDLVTLDSKSVSFEDKAYIISNFCECVIGYEGGIAHLCHMLNVPYIMLPWRTNFDCKLLHLDEKTYFLKSINEIMAWTDKKLFDVITDLHQGLGNNELLNNYDLKIKKWYQHPVDAKERNFILKNGQKDNTHN